MASKCVTIRSCAPAVDVSREEEEYKAKEQQILLLHTVILRCHCIEKDTAIIVTGKQYKSNIFSKDIVYIPNYPSFFVAFTLLVSTLEDDERVDYGDDTTSSSNGGTIIGFRPPPDGGGNDGDDG